MKKTKGMVKAYVGGQQFSSAAEAMDAICFLSVGVFLSAALNTVFEACTSPS